MKINVINFNQPAGAFYLATMPATEVVAIANIDRRQYLVNDDAPWGGVQREPSKKRIKEITAYSETVDASFPTPILLALDEDCYDLDEINQVLDIQKEGKIADVVDGQHRILGLADSSAIGKFQLPVIFILSATDEQKALLFATVNGKQTKVPASLVYDLFGVTEGRSPQKSSHEIARAFNSSPDSPYYRRLKMLGSKVHENESLTQGMFVKNLLPLISKEPMQDRDRIKLGESPLRNPALIFNKYFCDNEDSAILKILLNIFTSVKETWPDDWVNIKDSSLSRAVGFEGIMHAAPAMVKRGNELKVLSKGFFTIIFNDVAAEMTAAQLTFESKHFPASGAGPKKLQTLIEEAIVRRKSDLEAFAADAIEVK
jgi:DGQHR domain-containing protein